jgi:hypothetical protein
MRSRQISPGLWLIVESTGNYFFFASWGSEKIWTRSRTEAEEWLSQKFAQSGQDVM